MNTKQIKTLYESPEVEVVETKVRGAVLAASEPGSTDPYEREDW